MTIDIYTATFLTRIVELVDSPNVSLKEIALELLSDICNEPFNLVDRLLDSTDILRIVKNEIIKKKQKEKTTRRLFLYLLSCLTTIDHPSFASHMDLWKWILDFFLKAKKGNPKAEIAL